MTGTVYLVGSGPGDPELLTVKAHRLLDDADVVLHDKLPGPEIIDLLPEERREDVGKRAGGDRTPQSVTNERLVELAEAGETVVRLKGGDPFVFGRGGEEAAYLAEHGVPFEVVPGVTSAVDWDALAATGGTIVVLMGVGKLPDYTAALRDAGMDPETPVAMVERATWADQRVVTGTLDSIVDARDEAGIEPPANTVIGEVAGERNRLAAFLRGYGDDDPREATDG